MYICIYVYTYVWMYVYKFLTCFDFFSPVMDMATPMNTKKGPNSEVSPREERMTKDTPTPSTNGREIPAAAAYSAIFPVFLSARRSSSSPTRKRKRMRPKLAKVVSTVREAGGKTVRV